MASLIKVIPLASKFKRLAVLKNRRGYFSVGENAESSMKKDQMRHFVVIFSSAFTAVLILLYLLISQDPGCLR